MGKFKRNKTYLLAWEEGEFKGLEVLTRSIPTGRYLELMKELRGDNATEAAVLGMADFIIEWNLEDENDQPVPCTREGIMTVDLELITAVTRAWQNTIGGTDVPKDETSSSGSQLVEASLPMETSWESRAI